MRKNVVNAYAYFVKNLGNPVTPAELVAGAGLGTGGSGPGPIVWNLKDLLGLDIQTVKNGKTVANYVLNDDKPFVEPAAITAHYAKVNAEKPVKTKTVKAAKTVTVPKVDTLTVAGEPAIDVASVEQNEADAAKVKEIERKARKANRDKIRRAALKAAKANATAGEVETAEVNVAETETGVEDFPEFLKRTPEFAE